MIVSRFSGYLQGAPGMVLGAKIGGSRLQSDWKVAIGSWSLMPGDGPGLQL